MRRRGRKILVAMATLSLALALTLAVGASARESLAVDVKSKVTIGELTREGARGTVSSPEKECEPKREVVLQINRSMPPRKPDNWLQVGKDFTNQKGDWEIRKPDGLARDQYRVRVLFDRRGELDCEDDTSNPRDLR